jgi:hypothetical protein
MRALSSLPQQTGGKRVQAAFTLAGSSLQALGGAWIRSPTACIGRERKGVLLSERSRKADLRSPAAVDTSRQLRAWTSLPRIRYECELRRIPWHTAVTYEADGLRMVSHLYYGRGEARAIAGGASFPEAFGLGHHAKGRAERLVSSLRRARV